MNRRMEWIMHSPEISQVLRNERCGLFFLAGLDRNNKHRTLTVHTAKGNLSEENERFIRARFGEFDADLSVVIRHHAFKNLFEPRCLEHFIGTFSHDEIVCDPTGAFSRADDLLSLASRMRSEFGHWLKKLLWQSETGSLLLVLDPAAGKDPVVNPAMVKRLETTAWNVFESGANSDLSKVLNTISVVTEVPAGSHTPVDASSIDTHKKRKSLGGVIAKVSGIAGMIGLGSAALANAHLPESHETGTALPGISALNGLTSLGENALGQRNMFQALGGLRLYFGNSDPELMAACGMADFFAGKCVIDRYWSGGKGEQIEPSTSRTSYSN